MESILSFCDALQHVNEVKTEFSGVAYDEFIGTLKDFRRGKISSSIAFSTVQTLFQNHPNLLDACNTFKPRAAVEERSDVTASSVDFINRVKLRFRGGGVYSEFLNLMRAYSRRRMTASDACDKVVELFGGNDDLIEEVKGFLQRKVDDRNQTDSDEESQRARKKSGRAAGERSAKRDKDMEESMFEIEVRISNLESCRESAEVLKQYLSDGAVTAAEFIVAEHFTALDVACMRREDRMIVEHLQRDVVETLPQLIQILINNKESMEKQRLKIAKSWTKFRYTNIIH